MVGMGFESVILTEHPAVNGPIDFRRDLVFTVPSRGKRSGAVVGPNQAGV
jgi:hypothetical protein